MQRQPKLLVMWTTAPHFVIFSECSTKFLIDSWSTTTACFRLCSERRRSRKATSTQLLSAVASHLKSTSLLATALVRIVNNFTGTPITENIVQALRLKRHPVRFEITGIANTSQHQCRHSPDFTIVSCSGSQFNAYVSSAFILIHARYKILTEMYWSRLSHNA